MQIKAAALPHGWVNVSFADICNLNPRDDLSSFSDETLFSFIGMASVDALTGQMDATISRPHSAVRKGFTQFQNGDLLLAKITPCMENGKFCIAQDLINGRGFGSTEFHVLRAESGILAQYLFYWAIQQRFRNDAAHNMKGTAGQKRVPVDWIAASRLPLAPTREQVRIVAAIDELFARLATADLDLQSCAARTSRYLESVMFEEFGLQNFSANQSETGSALSEIFKIGTGATPLRSETKYYDSGTIPWITSSSVNSSTIESADQYITEAAIKETNCKVFPPGTLIVAMYGEGKTRGKVSRLAISAATNQACAALIPEIDDPLKVEYCRRFLEAGYEAMRRVASGGVQPNLNLGFFKGLRIEFPARNHIKGFLEKAEEAERTRDLALELVLAAQERSSALHQSILAAAFRGELVPQDPRDEPASVLLDRVRAQRAAAVAAPKARKEAPVVPAKRKRA